MTEPIRLYTVQIHWQAGPTLTAQQPIVDKLPLFVGAFHLRHLKASSNSASNGKPRSKPPLTKRGTDD